MTGPGEGPRPGTPAVAGAAGRTTAPLVAPGLRVLFCGINPSLRSASTGHHFAHPANRFWTALHRSGFTDRLLRPREQDELLDLGLGVTNIAARSTATAAELSATELREGALRLQAEVRALRPRWLAVLGVTAYRTAFRDPGAGVGPQALTVGPARVWLLPNPSGLNAHWTPTTLAEEFARLREAVGP